MPFKGSLAGMKILVVPDEPGYKLPEDMILKPEFREQFNAWAASFFKPKNLLADDRVIRTGDTLMMNPRMYEKLMEQIEPMLRYPDPFDLFNIRMRELEMPGEEERLIDDLKRPYRIQFY